MATTVATRRTPEFVENLKTQLVRHLRAGGIKARVETERVPATKLYRVMVLAEGLKKLKHSERQELVWRIAEKTLKVDEQLRISMILTLTPNELKGR